MNLVLRGTQGVQRHGCSKKKENRNFKIEKIGNFVLKKLEKNRKINVVLSSTKIASRHLIRVIMRATSPQLLRSQELDQLLRLRRSENDQ